MANRALLIGINHYPQPVNTLTSCIADTLAVKRLLQNNGFSDDDIHVLHDGQATLANARSALDWLFAEASKDDRLVFYESSHGYRYVKDGTMVEVLCLYDEFLEDHELSSRTQSLPSGVLTVLLDACYSGGMNKLFFPDGQVQAVRIKAFHPDPKQEQRDTKALQTVTKFKSFGHSSSGDTGVVAKAFALIPEGLPSAKAGSDLELNGLLFSACKADQTAADGSQATDGLSAFTYSLITSYQTGISSAALRDRAEQRLRDLYLQQTPLLEEPAQGPDLTSLSFIMMQLLGTSTVPQIIRKDDQPVIPTIPTDFNTALSTFAQQIAGQMKASGQKGYTPKTQTVPTDFNTALSTFAQQIADQMKASGQKGYTPWSGISQQEQNDAIKFASLLTPGLAQAIASNKGFQTQALPTKTFALTDPHYLQDKAWWNDVIAGVEQFTPYLISALSGGKGFQDQTGLASVQPEHLQDKAWWDDVVQIVSQAVPFILDALSGKKDYKVGGAAPETPAIQISNEHINDKAWYDDLLHMCAAVIPMVIAAL